MKKHTISFGLCLLLLLSSCSSSGWHNYSDTDSDSSIDAYKIEPDSISVRFNDGSIYLYTNASAGETNIKHMKELAKKGDGLNSFILKYVRHGYASKHR